jgi:hypothetical protein
MKSAGANAKKMVIKYKAGGMSHIIDDFYL